MNAKSIKWQSKLIDQRGVRVEVFIQQENLLVLSKHGFPPTFKNTSDGEKNIDVTFAMQHA